MRVLLIIIFAALSFWALLERNKLKGDVATLTAELEASRNDHDRLKAQMAAAKPQNWLQDRIEGRGDPFTRSALDRVPTLQTRPITPNSRVIR